MKSQDLSTSFLFLRRVKGIVPKQIFEKLISNTDKSRVYIVPSAIGFYFSFVAFVLFLIAISYGHNLAYFATFLFFSFVSISAVVTNESVHSISLELVDQAARVQPGQRSPYRLRVINKSRKDQFDITIEAQGKSLVLIDKLAGSSQKDVLIDLSQLELERGHYELKRLGISSRFPFGLFYAWKWIPVNLKLIVRPAPLDMAIRSFEAAGTLAGGGALSHRIGNDEYFETRGHRPGESLSRIDRRHSQRFNFPQIRVFSRDSEEIRIYDLRGNEVEKNLSAACSILATTDSDSSFGFIYPDESQYVVGRGQDFKTQSLDRLSVHRKELEVLS